MRQRLRVWDTMNSTDGGIVLRAGGRRWKLYVQDVVRIRDDWFVQMIALGPRACTVIIRTDDPDLRVKAYPIYRRIRDWLAAGAPRDCVFMDLLAQ